MAQACGQDPFGRMEFLPRHRNALVHRGPRCPTADDRNPITRQPALIARLRVRASATLSRWDHRVTAPWSGHTSYVSERPRWRGSLLARIYVLVGVLVVLVLATAAGSYVLSQRTVSALTHLESVSLPAQTSASELIRSNTEQAENVRGYLLTGDPLFLQADTAAQAQAGRTRATLGRQLAGDPGSTQILAEIDSSAATWRNDYANPGIDAVRSGAAAPNQVPSVTPPTDTPGERSFEALRGRLDDLQRHIGNNAAAETAQANSTRALANQLTAATCVLAVGLAVVMVFFLRHSLTRPLSRLVADVSEVSRGDLDRPVRPSGPPELATTADAVERMRVRILEQTHAASQAQQQLARYEESERIAHGLHDRVIQSLVGTGMMLQSTASRHPALALELSATIDAIDRTIQELRTVIFGLTGEESGTGIRQRILEILRDSERHLGFPPRVQFHGVIDPLITDDIAAELIPTVQECLSNIARHAHAGRADVSLAATDEELVLHVTDDGVGIDVEHRPPGHGLSDIRRRAEHFGGTCTVSAVRPHGTAVDWRVPLPSPSAD